MRWHGSVGLTTAAGMRARAEKAGAQLALLVVNASGPRGRLQDSGRVFIAARWAFALASVALELEQLERAERLAELDAELSAAGIEVHRVEVTQ